MIATDKIQAVISELIIINNDRYEGYKTAAEETSDEDLKATFERFSAQSKLFAGQLRKFISFEDSPEEDETKHSGKFYRVWMNIRAELSNHDRKAILSSCEFGEDVAVNTYQSALEEEEVSSEVKIAIRNQYREIQEAHHMIKSMRDRA